MTATCPLCKSEIADNNPALFIEDLKKAVHARYGWTVLANKNEGFSFGVGNYTAKVVATKNDPGYPANGYDGAWEQGSTFEAYVVVEVNGNYFKKTGTGDSYGEISWDGDLTVVTPKEKVVTYFD